MNKKTIIIGSLAFLGVSVGAYFYLKPKTATTAVGVSGGITTSNATTSNNAGTPALTTGSSTATNTGTNTGTTSDAGNGTSQSPLIYNTPAQTEISPASLSDLQAVVYLNKYADLNATFGADLQKAKQHWVSLGKAEGRTIPLVKNSVSTPTQLSDDQALIYLAKYSDLLATFGVNLPLAKQHWVNLGKGEGRTIDIVI